jgi:hypothetical protein
MSHPMTTLVEEMAKAIKNGRPAYRGDDFDYDLAAQAALDCVLKRLADAPDEWLEIVCKRVWEDGDHVYPASLKLGLAALAIHLHQERKP